VALSEFEKRELELIRQGLEQEDPRLAAMLGRHAVGLSLRARVTRGLILFAAGVCVLLLGLVIRAPYVGIAGFAVMNGACYWALKDLRWSPRKVDGQVNQMEGNNG
jgi:hypothetical protein